MNTASISIPSAPSARNARFYDLAILSLTFLMIMFSLLMVYSTTGVISTEKFSDPYYYLKRQLVAVLLGIGVMFIVARVKISFLEKISVFCLPAACLLLVATFLPGIGNSAGGASRWINLGIVRFQPAECVKLLFIIFIAGYLSRHEAKLSSFKAGIVKPFIFVCMVAGLLLKQPDFGSAAVIAIIAFSMVAVSGARLRHMVLCVLVLIGCGATLIFISPYRMSRVISFMSPWADASGKGYQLIQSLIAVGSGQMTGVGLGASQQKLFFLPAAHTDFIFAVVGEELGFIGCLIVMSLFLLFLWRGLYLASRVSSNVFAFSLICGLTLLIALPALLNIGVVTGMLPTKGLVLPLIGYGGTSVVTCLTAVGLLLALSRSEKI
jgi:cell division protein FtsW